MNFLMDAGILGNTGWVDTSGYWLNLCFKILDELVLLLFIILRYPHPDQNHLLFASDFFLHQPGLQIKGL